MKIKFSKVFALMLTAAVLLIPFSGDAQSRKRSASKRKTTSAALPVIKQTDKTLQNGATTVSITHYDAPAFYKVSADEAGFSNGYCDSSFSIDWPTAVSTGDVASLQQWILGIFSSDEQPLKTLDALIKSRNKCDYTGRRVAKLPKNDDENCLRSKADATAKLITSSILVFQVDYDAYFGGGTGASFYYGTSYSYYDLNKQRGLKSSDLFTTPVAQLIVRNLNQNQEDLWEDISEEFKHEPYLSENFTLSNDKVTFVYSKYEIGPGYMGNVEVEVPLQQVLPYATPTLKSIISAMN